MVTDSMSFPHPVLGLADDIAGQFNVNIKVERNSSERLIEFRVHFNIVDNQYFQTLIQLNKANLLVKVYCSSTFKTWSFLASENVKAIREDDLCNKVEIEALIIALEDIPDYSDSTFNSQYGGQSFYVNKYDIIGLTGAITIPIDKEYEKLGLGNIFEFVAEDTHTKPCSFDFNTDKIMIKYPPTQSGDHPPNALFNRAAWTSYNIFIVPALTEAFRLMGDDDKKNEFEDKEWYYVLDMLLPESERDDDAFKSAQLLLNKEIPLLKAFEEICNN